MDLEQNPENMDTINEIFRAAHSLKGMAGTMGYKRMQTLTHDMENVFSEVRNGTFKVLPGMIDILFKSLDALEEYVNNIQQTTEEGTNDNQDLIDALNSILKNNGEVIIGQSATPTKAVEAAPTVKDESANTIKDLIFDLAISGLGMMTANFIGFDVAFSESLPGVLVLLLIALCAAGLAHIIPLKLPTVAYCSILGLLCACPLSPVSEFVIQSAGKINFTAPLTMVGAFAGMSISNQLKMFFKQGWKLIVITVLVMTGTFFGSLVLAQAVLRLTHAI